LVQLQNGAMGVQSACNQGSLFWIELPLVVTQAPQQSSHTSVEGIAAEVQPRIFLVVDDQAVNLLVAQRLLQKYGLLRGYIPLPVVKRLCIG
jgi:hypothetical protein